MDLASKSHRAAWLSNPRHKCNVDKLLSVTLSKLTDMKARCTCSSYSSKSKQQSGTFYIHTTTTVNSSLKMLCI